MKSGGELLKVAAVQAAPVLLDLDKSVDKAVALIDEAGAQGVKLLAFPETWIGGYPWWIWLGTPAHTMKYIGDYTANSIVAGSEHDKKLAAAARRNEMHVVIGVSERDKGSLYMGQWHYAANGEVLSRRRKLKPTMAERAVFGEGDGSDLIVNDTDIGRIGALCCWEHMQSLVKFSLYSQHEQLHVASWPAYSCYTDVSYALSPEMSMSINRTYAGEGQCFVLSSCAVITPEIQDMLCETEEQKGFLKLGGGYSRIFSPDGASCGEPLEPDEEGLLIADISLGMIAYAKAACDPVGHYGRADVLQLLINKEPRSLVKQIGSSDHESSEPTASQLDAEPDVEERA